MSYTPDSRIQLAMPTPTKLLTPGVTVLLVIMVIGFALLSWARGFAFAALGLSPSQVLHGQVWRLVTYSFLNGGCALIANMFVVLFIGSAIEREWRTASFLKLWFAVVVACALFWLGVSVVYPRLRGISAIGSTGAAYGLIGAFGLLYNRRRLLVWFWTMEGQHFAMLLIAIGLIISIAAPLNLIWVSGAGVAYLYVRFVWSRRDRGSAATRRAMPEVDRFKDLG